MHFKLNKAFILFYFLTLICISSSEKIANFVTNLYLQRYSHCTLFFVRDSDLERIGESLLYNVVTKTNSVYYNVRYNNYKSSDNIKSENFRPNPNLISTTNMSYPVFKISVSNYNKKSDVCKLVVLPITDIRTKIFQHIKRTIAPVYLPITQKDSDRYVYVTKVELTDKLLRNTELPAKTKYKIALAEDHEKQLLVVKSVCFFCNEGSPTLVQFPVTSPAAFEYFPDYVLNLQGKLVRIACPAIRSRIEADPPYTGVNNAKRGMWKTLFEEFLIVKFNFTYNIFVSTGKDGKFGGGGTGLELSNGTWIGTVGDIVAGKADFAIVTANTPKRIKQVSFSNSFFDISYLNFITANGKRVYSPVALLWPFDLTMWFCIFLSTIVAFMVFKLITRSMSILGMDSKDAMSYSRRGIVSEEAWGLRHQIFFVTTSYLDQDCVMPRFISLRCFVAMWLFFSLVITTIYRTKMVSLLAFPVLATLPQTFNELVKSDYQVGFIKQGDSAYNTLKASTDPVYVKLLEEMEIITGNGLECLEKVISQHYACIAYDFSTIYLKARNLSDGDVRKLVFAPETTLAMEGGSIYKESFEKWLGWTRPFHLAYLWEERDMYYNVRLPKRAWLLATNQTDKLAKSDNKESDDLTLKHISGAFYAIILCLLVCSLVFMQEVLYFHQPHKIVKTKLNKFMQIIKLLKWKRMGTRR